MASFFFGSKMKKLAGEDLIRCLLCANVVKEPCYMSCCKDVFCRDCVSNYSSYQKINRPVCPSCLSRNFRGVIAGIPSENCCKRLGSCCNLEGTWGSCQECRNQSAIGRCIRCTSVPPLCKECIKQHEANGHLVISSATTINARCTRKIHSTNDLNAYCENCDLPCCLECSVKDHLGHKVQDIDSVIEQHVGSARNIKDALKQEIERADSVIQQLKEAYKLKCNDMDKLMKDISTHVMSLIDQLRRNESELKKLCENICKLAENVMEKQVNNRKYTKRRMQLLLCLINDISHPGQKFPLLLHFKSLRRYAEHLCQQNSEKLLDIVHPLTVRHRFQMNSFPDVVGKFVEDACPGALPDVETVHSRSDDVMTVCEREDRTNSELLTKPVKIWSRFQRKADGGSAVPYGCCFASYDNDQKCVVAQYASSSLFVISEFSATQRHCELRQNKFCPRSVIQMPHDAPRFAVTDNFEMRIKIIDCSLTDQSVGRSSTLLRINQKFVDPSGLALLAKSHDFVVSDVQQRTVSRIACDGQLLWSVGGSSGEAYSSVADFLAVDHHDRIVLTDRKQDCIKVLDSDGRSLMQFGSNVGLAAPAGVCVNWNSDIFVADSANHRVLMFSSDGRLIQEVLKTDWPFGITLSKDGKYLCLTSKDGNLSMFKLSQ